MNQIKLNTFSSMVKVLHNQTPTAFPETQGSTFQNEGYTFQAVITAAKNAQNCRLQFGSKLAGYVTTYIIKEMPSYQPLDEKCDDYMLHSTDSCYPELCEQGNEFSIKANENTCVLIEIKGELPTGTYALPITLICDGEEKASCTYTLTVIAAQLPVLETPVTHWFHCDCIAELHGVEIFSQEWYQVAGKYIDAYVEMGNTMLLIPTITPALDTEVGHERMTAQLVDITVENGEYSFDFSALDAFIDFVTQKGIRYYEFAHLFTQWGVEFCPKVMAKVDGENKKIFGWETQSESDEYKAFLSAYLPALCAYIHEKGIEKNSFIHLSDEPNESALERYGRLYAFVKPLIGDLRTLDALSEYTFYEKGYVDVPVPITVTANQFADHNVYHLAYYCCWPCTGYESNRFFAMPGERTRVIGYQLYKNNANGFLQWGYNFYHSHHSLQIINPYEDTSGGNRFASGDSFIVYPDIQAGGVKKSLRWFYMKEAFQDWRALLLLEKLCGRARAMAILQEYGIHKYHVYPHSSKVLKELREVINETISGCVSATQPEIE